MKRPPSASDLDAIRLTFQKYRAPSVLIRMPNPQITAELARDVYVLEYPSVAAIDWRIATFKRWPLATAVDWQAGMVTMQMVAAAGNILKKHPFLVPGAASVLHWPVTSGKSSPAPSNYQRASRCLSVTNVVVESQVIDDMKEGAINIGPAGLENSVLLLLHMDVKRSKSGNCSP
ncbi:MAG: hypothetical protein ACYCUV_05925 [Phycisphaerae bacterium]